GIDAAFPAEVHHLANAHDGLDLAVHRYVAEIAEDFIRQREDFVHIELEFRNLPFRIAAPALELNPVSDRFLGLFDEKTLVRREGFGNWKGNCLHGSHGPVIVNDTGIESQYAYGVQAFFRKYVFPQK